MIYCLPLLYDRCKVVMGVACNAHGGVYRKQEGMGKIPIASGKTFVIV